MGLDQLPHFQARAEIETFPARRMALQPILKEKVLYSPTNSTNNREQGWADCGAFCWRICLARSFSWPHGMYARKTNWIEVIPSTCRLLCNWQMCGQLTFRWRKRGCRLPPLNSS